jgi:hypothetical protein
MSAPSASWVGFNPPLTYSFQFDHTLLDLIGFFEHDATLSGDLKEEASGTSQMPPHYV